MTDKHITIRVQKAPFDVSEELGHLTKGAHGIGGAVTFTGLVRDVTNDTKVSHLTLEHYPGMTERELTRIAEEACERFALDAACIIHRVGELDPGDPIVLVIAAAAHRGAAFDGARFMMDFLKTDAPFWKKEQTPEGEAWVDARASDTSERDKWA